MTDDDVKRLQMHEAHEQAPETPAIQEKQGRWSYELHLNGHVLCLGHEYLVWRSTDVRLNLPEMIDTQIALLNRARQIIRNGGTK